MLDHGGNLDVAIERFGGRLDDWIDLSTGINRRPYPVGEWQPRHWRALPSGSDIEALHEAARQAYATTAPVLATAGAQAAIQLLPRLAPRGRTRILAPTYDEYAAILNAAGWHVEQAIDLAALAGMLGPWPISGAAIEIGRRALLDRDWANATTARLAGESSRLDALAKEANWALVGGTSLFRLYETGDANAAQARLAGARIWSRVFKDAQGWLRLGLPGSDREWARLAAVLAR